MKYRWAFGVGMLRPRFLSCGCTVLNMLPRMRAPASHFHFHIPANMKGRKMEVSVILLPFKKKLHRHYTSGLVLLVRVQSVT